MLKTMPNFDAENGRKNTPKKHFFRFWVILGGCFGQAGGKGAKHIPAYTGDS